MVTVRTYWNPIDAALHKSLLDNYEIECAVLHENSNLYSRGAQFAVPVRLVVDEGDVDRAICILSGDLEKAAMVELVEEKAETVSDSASSFRIANRNPWELLVLAFYLAVPAICVLCTKFPKRALGNFSRYYVARGMIAHFLSWLAIMSAVALVFEYFRVRRSSMNLPSKRAGDP